jgi:hypothetical protein
MKNTKRIAPSAQRSKKGRVNIDSAFLFTSRSWLLLQGLGPTLAAEQQQDNRQRLGK